jgi:hypothetical protein
MKADNAFVYARRSSCNQMSSLTPASITASLKACPRPCSRQAHRLQSDAHAHARLHSSVSESVPTPLLAPSAALAIKCPRSRPPVDGPPSLKACPRPYSHQAHRLQSDVHAHARLHHCVSESVPTPLLTPGAALAIKCPRSRPPPSLRL